ncbi:MAG: methyltransferase domain-containing protein [Betaproteobacteria bacterium]|nr:methyltransferase domain-containing protein [Betaproteobacteria bacterium]
MPPHFSRRTLLRAACLGALLLGISTSRAYDDGTTPFVVTPSEVVERMLHLAAPKAGDYLIDLGSGDGRIVIEAAKRFGASGLGVDIDPRLVELSRQNAVRAGVAERTRFEVLDLFDTDLSKANVVTMYLLPEVNLKLRPRLIEMLKPGTRIVSHDYDLGDWAPDETIELRTPDKLVGPVGRSRVMLWIVPADLRGRWAGVLAEHGGAWHFDIAQKYQLLEVKARSGAGEVFIRGVGLKGNDVIMLGTGTIGGKVWNHRFNGTLKGERIEGELRVSDGEQTKRMPWSASRSR